MKPPSTVLTDFSDRWSPVLVKELRQGLRSPMFVMPFLLVHRCVLVALAAEMSAAGEAAGGGSRSGLGLVIQLGGSPFWVVTAVVTAVVMPLRSFGSLFEEVRAGQSELLLLGGLSRWQVVGGKWCVQMLFCGLVLLSLTPYLIVRYFLGGFDVWGNVMTMLNVIGAASAISGGVIGASGYRSVTMRLVAVAVCGFWVLGVGTFNQAIIKEVATGGGMVLYGVVSGLSFFVLYTATGLQLGRSHLKLSLLPYEMSPRGNMMALLCFLPMMVIAGVVVTCGFGALPVILILAVAMFRHDAPWRPGKGRRPETVTGFDTGWRPMY